MSSLDPKTPFFSYVGPDGSVSTCLLDENASDPSLHHVGFSIVGTCDLGTGVWNRDAGTLETIVVDDVVHVASASDVIEVASTAYMLGEDYDFLVTLVEPAEHVEHSIVYAALFRSEPANRASRSNLMDDSGRPEDDIDEDEAYERMMDPERRAVAAAYAAA